MDKLELIIPNLSELEVNTTDLSLYNYDFENFSLAPIQEAAAKDVYKKISKKLTRNVATGKLAKKVFEDKEVEYVAKLSDSVKKQLSEGKLDFVYEKITGETKATLRDTKTGNIIGSLNLDKKELKDLGTLPELASMQAQLKDISKQLENINQNIKRVEQGQYNDRYAGFFSTRQMLIESMALNNKHLKQQLLLSTIQSSNETISKLMLTLRQDVNEFLDLKKLKPKEAKNFEIKISNSFCYLNSTVQLNFIIYTLLEEPNALLATMTNYRSFIDKIFLTPIGDNENSVAWKIDNAKTETSYSIENLTSHVSENIKTLVNNTNIMNEVLDDE